MQYGAVCLVAGQPPSVFVMVGMILTYSNIIFIYAVKQHFLNLLYPLQKGDKTLHIPAFYRFSSTRFINEQSCN